MDKELSKYQELLDDIEQIMTKVGLLHSSSISFGTGIPLHLTEIHTIQTIGQQPGVTVTSLAKLKGVTKGAVSQTITKLIKKGLVYKTYSETNAKERRLELTELGWKGFYAHEQLHSELLTMFRDYLGNNFITNLQLIKVIVSDINKLLEKYDK